MVSPSTEDMVLPITNEHALVIWAHLSHDMGVSRAVYMDMHGSKLGLEHQAIWSAYAHMVSAYGVYEEIGDLCASIKHVGGDASKQLADRRIARKEWKAKEDGLSALIFTGK